jgi:hypothetical protein
VLQQEQQIQLRQDQVEEQGRLVHELRKELEKRDFDVKDMGG